ncbi:hypothetical protein GC163_10985 [bacterium]|nr:hypothetical protein [bacterium]
MTSALAAIIAGKARAAGLFQPGQPSVVYFLSVFLVYFLKAQVFVLIGSRLAPRAQRSAAVALAGIMILLSLATHGWLPQRVGWVNGLHAGVEAFGALCGMAWIWLVGYPRPAQSIDSSK